MYKKCLILLLSDSVLVSCKSKLDYQENYKTYFVIISSLSFKGGVGKSTFATNIAVAFAKKGYKVCLIDADDVTKSAMKWASRRDAKGHEPRVQTVGVYEPKGFIQAVRGQYENYDVLVIDSPPSDKPVSSKIILSSSMVVIPVASKGAVDLWIVEDFLQRFEQIQDSVGTKIPAYFLLNQYKPGLNLHRAFEENLAKYSEAYEVGVLTAKFHERVAYGECIGKGLGVVEYDNKLAKNEVNFAMEELLTIGKEL